ncbi:MAG: hypothetical protein M3Y48_19890 [Actinomycetota bacterium]|nr:hypothetical protein [Actinomycetota bacterium]
MSTAGVAGSARVAAQVTAAPRRRKRCNVLDERGPSVQVCRRHRDRFPLQPGEPYPSSRLQERRAEQVARSQRLQVRHRVTVNEDPFGVR